MPAELGNVRLFFGPKEYGAPDALLTPLVDVVLNARDSLFVATHQLTHREIVTALAIARRRGLDVRVLLERDYVRESPARDDIWARGGRFERHRGILNALFRANLNVRVERRARLMHQNFVLADVDTDDATVVMTSANLTPNGMHKNLNHMVVIRNKRVARRFEAEFDALWVEELDSPHADRARRVNEPEVSIKPVFGPEQDPEGELVELVEASTRSVLFAVTSFSTGSAIDEALLKASQAGRQVLGVLDGVQAHQHWAATDRLEQGGVDLYVTEDLLPTRLHHKLMVLDDSTLCLGTLNFSVSGASANEEVAVILEPRGSESTALAEYTRQEVLRIRRQFAASASRLLGG